MRIPRAVYLLSRRRIFRAGKGHSTMRARRAYVTPYPSSPRNYRPPKSSDCVCVGGGGGENSSEAGGKCVPLARTAPTVRTRSSRSSPTYILYDTGASFPLPPPLLLLSSLLLTRRNATSVGDRQTFCSYRTRRPEFLSAAS